MSVQSAILLTADEFSELGDMGPAELIRGEVIHLTAPRPKHGKIAMRIGAAMHRFVRKHKLGDVYAAETGYCIEHNPDTIRCPDASFVRQELVDGHDPDEYYPYSPDLAVEVLSPSDRPQKVKEKTQAWLKGGARAVWVIDGVQKTLTEFRRQPGRSGKPRIWTANETFEDSLVLKGFSISPLDKLFRGLDRKK